MCEQNTKEHKPSNMEKGIKKKRKKNEMQCTSDTQVDDYVIVKKKKRRKKQESDNEVVSEKDVSKDFCTVDHTYKYEKTLEEKRSEKVSYKKRKRKIIENEVENTPKKHKKKKKKKKKRENNVAHFEKCTERNKIEDKRDEKPIDKQSDITCIILDDDLDEHSSNTEIQEDGSPGECKMDDKNVIQDVKRNQSDDENLNRDSEINKSYDGIVIKDCKSNISNNENVTGDSEINKSDGENMITDNDGYSPVHEIWKINKDKKEFLRRKGILFKEGKWSSKEIKQLRKNVSEFHQEHGEEELKSLLFAKDLGKVDTVEFLRSQQMYQKFAKGIDRCLQSVYRKVKRMYNENNFKGRWSSYEEKELIRLYNLYGSRWVLIGQLLQRSPETAYSKFINLLSVKDKRLGFWRPEEEEKLREAVVMFSKPGDKLEVSWSAVSSHVKTRNVTQCRNKWVDHFIWAENEPNKCQWGLDEDIELIKRVHACCLEDEADIDWGEIMKGYSCFAQCPSAVIVRRKWKKLMNHVPNYHKIEFHEIVEHLFTTEIPLLEMKKSAANKRKEIQVRPSEDMIPDKEFVS